MRRKVGNGEAFRLNEAVSANLDIWCAAKAKLTELKTSIFRRIRRFKLERANGGRPFIYFF